MNDVFKDATPTSTLVIKPQNNIVDIKKLDNKNLQKLTKNDLVELAEEKFGIELDRRFTKNKMIEMILTDDIHSR
tara:strand:- start:653 stop:877 length:225 start_codon:yes stop_codon:yes gene_type:complete